ncbi:MAG: carboxypeptidase M32 [Treponema sp.]|nr:carboxypeptidase M32 [Treponema sp.]
MNNNISPAGCLERLRVLDRERMHISRAAALLQWDQETYLPSGGIEERAEQLAVLEGLAHERLINNEVGELLGKLRDAFSLDNAVHNAQDEFPADDFIRVLHRDYEKAVKIPVDFVRECAKAEGLSQAAWIEARKHNNFAAFAPHLEKMLDFAKQKAAFWGWERTKLYDGLLDYYEPSLGVHELTAIFGPLRDRLQLLLQKIAAKPNPGNVFINHNFEKAKQEAFCREVLSGIGFDGKRGRMDISAHPFTTALGFNDVRITTRYAASDPLSGLFSVIHEGGHAFYELGLDKSLRYSSLAEGTSMGIHESQSRLWENVIGRSRVFWEPWYPRLKDYFSPELGTVDFESFYRTVNNVVPGPIRVEADEVSYSLHIILRFELEEKLFSGKLSVNELPEAWNAGMKDYLNVECTGDAEGVLQDVHWSMGAFGYFPSYALGNLYALQFWNKLQEDIGTTDQMLRRRDYGTIHSWLRDNIHHKGRCKKPAELIMDVTGNLLSADSFFRYIEQKYTELYGL